MMIFDRRKMRFKRSKSSSEVDSFYNIIFVFSYRKWVFVVDRSGRVREREIREGFNFNVGDCYYLPTV